MALKAVHSAVTALMRQSAVRSRQIYLSAPRRKKPKIFYNKYIEQLRRRKRIFTGYVHDVVREQEERTHIFNEDLDDADFEEELLREGKRRQRCYVRAKRIKEIEKGPGPRLLTWQQMEQIRFLKQSEPGEWDVKTLAHSFQVPELVIRKVLRNKSVLPQHAIDKIDSKAHLNFYGFLKKTKKPEKFTQSKSLAVMEDEPLSVEEQWGLPQWKNLGWFAGYEKTNTLIENKSEISRKKKGITWLEDDECEFYEDLYRSKEEAVYDEDDNGEHDEEQLLDNESYNEEEAEDMALIITRDGNNFYNDGELLYRIENPIKSN